MISPKNDPVKNSLDEKQMKKAIEATFTAFDQLSEFFERLRKS